MLHTLHMKFYRPTSLQGLKKDDLDWKLEFYEWYMICNESDSNFYNNILWTDEATFKLNERVNRHNSV